MPQGRRGQLPARQFSLVEMMWQDTRMEPKEKQASYVNLIDRIYVGHEPIGLDVFVQQLLDELVVFQVEDEQVDYAAGHGSVQHEIFVCVQLFEGNVSQFGIKKLSGRVHFEHPLHVYVEGEIGNGFN